MVRLRLRGSRAAFFGSTGAPGFHKSLFPLVVSTPPRKLLISLGARDAVAGNRMVHLVASGSMLVGYW